MDCREIIVTRPKNKKETPFSISFSNIYKSAEANKTLLFPANFFCDRRAHRLTFVCRICVA